MAMAEVKYTIRPDQKPTAEQSEMIRAARIRQDQLLAEGRKEEVYDEDSPETDPIDTPERYRAMMEAVAQRNRRIAALSKKRA